MGLFVASCLILSQTPDYWPDLEFLFEIYAKVCSEPLWRTSRKPRIVKHLGRHIYTPCFRHWWWRKKQTQRGWSGTWSSLVNFWFLSVHRSEIPSFWCSLVMVCIIFTWWIHINTSINRDHCRISHRHSCLPRIIPRGARKGLQRNYIYYLWSRSGKLWNIGIERLVTHLFE